MYLELSERIATQSGLGGVDRFICLLLGLYCVWSVANGLSTGTIPLKFVTIKRSELPPVFWFSMAMHCVGGAWLIVGAITGTIHW